MKLIAGTFTARPGRCAAYLAAARDHLEPSCLDPDCLWIELCRCPTIPTGCCWPRPSPSRVRHWIAKLILQHKTCGPIRGGDRRPHHPRSG